VRSAAVSSVLGLLRRCARTRCGRCRAGNSAAEDCADQSAGQGSWLGRRHEGDGRVAGPNESDGFRGLRGGQRRDCGQGGDCQ
jgi:hypothetical protein